VLKTAALRLTFYGRSTYATACPSATPRINGPSASLRTDCVRLVYGGPSAVETALILSSLRHGWSRALTKTAFSYRPWNPALPPWPLENSSLVSVSRLRRLWGRSRQDAGATNGVRRKEKAAAL